MPGPFPYLLSSIPPVPGCSAALRWGNHVMQCWAIIDTGADRTFIPVRYVRDLHVNEAGDVEIVGPRGSGEVQGLYHVNLEFLGLAFNYQPVVSLNWHEILIGRDIINTLAIMLDGPRRRFSID
jgi:predicted aspartyl protease